MDDSGRIIVADAGNHRVQVFDNNGTFQFAFGNRGNAEGQLDRPGDVSVDESGNVIVADTGNNRIQVFDPQGTFRFAFGDSDDRERRLRRPNGVAVDSSGSILVACDDDRIRIFDAEGKYKSSFTAVGRSSGISVDDAGNVYLAALWNDTVQVYDAEGVFQYEFGGASEAFRGRFGVARGLYQFMFGDYVRQLRRPSDVAVNADGRILVADVYSDGVRVYGPTPLDGGE